MFAQLLADLSFTAMDCRLWRHFAFFFILLARDAACACTKKDGAYCETLMNKILKTVSISSKCSQWVAMLDAIYFVSELFIPVEKRTITRDYCPVSCNYCSLAASTSTVAKTLPSTRSTASQTESPTLTPTTPKPEEMLKQILSLDSDFRRLTGGLDLTKDAQDSLLRYQMFEKNRERVQAHNMLYESGKSSYRMAVNQFSVAKPDELAPLSLSLPPPIPLSDVMNSSKRRKRQAKNDTVDFREHMQPITNQQSCGGCWAFATVAALEGYFAIKEEEIPPLSVQQLLDCDRKVSATYGVGNQGCGGGYFQVAAEYLQMKGLTSSEKYSFRGEASTCQLSSSADIPRMRSFDAGYVLTNNATDYELLDAAMEERVRKGPVAVGMAVSSSIYSYSEGVFDGICGSNINHAVVIVGFTSQYWIIRNSWGPSWGENGYIRVLRRADDPCKLTVYWAQPSEVGTFETGNIEENFVVEPQAETSTSKASNNEYCDGENCDSCDCEDDNDDYYYSSEWKNSNIDATTEVTVPLVDESATAPLVLENAIRSATEYRRWRSEDNWWQRS